MHKYQSPISDLIDRTVIQVVSYQCNRWGGADWQKWQIAMHSILKALEIHPIWVAFSWFAGSKGYTILYIHIVNKLL